MSFRRHAQRVGVWSFLLLMAWAMVTIHAEESAERQRALRLQQMRTLAEQTEVRLMTADRPAVLVPNPVFRYDDQPRHFIDATMWVWTDAGQPVAFQKIEAVIQIDTREPLWGYCFTSLANQPLAMKWADAKPYVTPEAGLKLNPFPGMTEPVAANATARKLQMNRLARRFGARIILNPRTNETAEMRLLPKPIFEFFDAEGKLPLGAVYGFSSNGTNPDLLVMLQAVTNDDSTEWHFSPTRMTTGGLKLRWDEELVWETEFVSPHAGPFPTWTFFRTPREEIGP